MTPEQKSERIIALEAMLRARRGQKGFEENVKEIEAELERLKGEADGPTD